MDEDRLVNLIVNWIIIQKIKKALQTGLGLAIAVLMWAIVLYVLYILGIGHM